MFKWKGRTPLSHISGSNQKLEMIKLSEEGMSKAERGWKMVLLCQRVTQVLTDKEEFLKEIKSSLLWTHKIVRKQNSLIADMEKILVVWMEDQTNYNIYLNQNLIQSKALIFSILWRLGEVRKLQKEHLKPAERLVHDI